MDKYFPDLNLHPLTRLAIAVAVYAPLMPVFYAFFKIVERPSIRLGNVIATEGPTGFSSDVPKREHLVLRISF